MSETTGQPRLLIVDDEVEVRGVLHDLLSGTYECGQADSGEDALAQLSEQDYQLVISDITMSGMSGLEMIPHVKVVSPDTVIVMISGMQTIESAINALRLGAFDYLMKPFDLRQAEAAVWRRPGQPQVGGGQRPPTNSPGRMFEKHTTQPEKTSDRHAQ